MLVKERCQVFHYIWMIQVLQYFDFIFRFLGRVLNVKTLTYDLKGTIYEDKTYSYFFDGDNRMLRMEWAVHFVHSSEGSRSQFFVNLITVNGAFFPHFDLFVLCSKLSKISKFVIVQHLSKTAWQETKHLNVNKLS